MKVYFFFVNRLLRLELRIPKVWQKNAQNKRILSHALKFEGFANANNIMHIYGDHDALLPLRAISGAKIISGGGHFMFTEKRTEVLEAIRAAVFQ